MTSVAGMRALAIIWPPDSRAAATNGMAQQVLVDDEHRQGAGPSPRPRRRGLVADQSERAPASVAERRRSAASAAATVARDLAAAGPCRRRTSCTATIPRSTSVERTCGLPRQTASWTPGARGRRPPHLCLGTSSRSVRHPASGRADARGCVAASARGMIGRRRSAPRRQAGLRRHQDQRAGHEGAAFGGPLAPVLRPARRPLRLDQVLEHQAGADDGPHPVADGAVVLDVDRASRRRRSRRRDGGRSRRRRPGGPRGRGSRGTASASGGSPTRRTARRAAAPGPPRRSAPSTSATNGSPPKAEHATSTAAVGQRQRAGVGLQQRDVDAGRAVQLGGAGQHPGREVQRDDVGTRLAAASARRAPSRSRSPAPAARRRPRAGARRPPAAPRGTRGSRRRRGRSRARRGRPARRRPTSGGWPGPTPRRRPDGGRRRRRPDSRRCPAAGPGDRAAAMAHDAPIVTRRERRSACAHPGGPGGLGVRTMGMRQRSVVLFPTRGTARAGSPRCSSPWSADRGSSCPYASTVRSYQPHDLHSGPSFQHPPGRDQRHRLRRGLPRGDRPDDQVLQRWRHRRGRHRQGRPGRGAAGHRLQDRGRHPLARTLHQARRRPATRSSRSATRWKPWSSRRRTRKGG